MFQGTSDISFWSVESDTDLVKSAKQRIREKNVGKLKRELYDTFNEDATSKSQKQFVNELLEQYRDKPLSADDVRLDCTEYRLVYRFITNSTNERTFIATVLPPGIVTLHSIYTIRPFTINPTQEDLSSSPLHSVYDRVFTDSELFVAVGLFNSIPFDFIMRTKVGEEIYQYTFKETQVPRLTAGDSWFEYISERAARLNCYGRAFAEMRERLGGIDPATDPEERKHLQAEIDAAAFHAYGLDRDETTFVLGDFHRVQNPHFMTEGYFELVLEKYDALVDHS